MRNTVTAVLDERPLGAWQLILVLLVLAILVIDGLDNHLLSLVGPTILAEWSISKAMFGPALSASFFGMVIGAGIGGWFGDRFGRKTVLVGSAFLFGAATFATSSAGSIGSLIALRFISGLGFGAAGPTGMALASEWLPQRARSKAISLLAAATPFGGMFGATIVLSLLPTYGWRGCFIACGMFTILLIAAIMFALPESPSYLLRRGKPAAVLRYAQRMLADPPVEDMVLDPRVAAAESGNIFVPENRWLNAGAWLSLLSITALAYATTMWGPLYLTMAGLPLDEALRANFAFNLCSLGIMLVGGSLVDRFGSRRVMLIACALTFAFLALLGMALKQPEWSARGMAIIVSIGGLGATAGLIIGATYSVLAHAYPSACRSTGLGFGHLMGRTGGIIITLSGGVLLSFGNDLMPFLLSLAAAVVLTIVGICLVDHHIPARAGRHTPAPLPSANV